MQPTNALNRSIRCTNPCSNRKSKARYTVGGADAPRCPRNRSNKSYAPAGAAASNTSPSTSRRNSVSRVPRRSHNAAARSSLAIVVGVNSAAIRAM